VWTKIVRPVIAIDAGAPRRQFWTELGADKYLDILSISNLSVEIHSITGEQG
jgi:hypothetical protein